MRFTFVPCMTKPVIMVMNQIKQHMGHCPITKLIIIISDEESNDMFQCRCRTHNEKDAELCNKQTKNYMSKIEKSL